MAKSDVDGYIDELRGFAGTGEDLDLYSLKKELNNLSESSGVFDDFEKETRVVDKKVLAQVQDLSLLIKIKNLASEIKSKSRINEKLHSLHFNLNLLKNNLSINNAKSIKNTFHAFLHDGKTKIDCIINELNDFKAKLNEIKKCHSDLLSKTLDNKLEIENKYDRHVEQIYSIHRKQKDALISIVKLFLKLTKKHIKNLKRFK